jgi:hypothetical protein
MIPLHAAHPTPQPAPHNSLNGDNQCFSKTRATLGCAIVVVVVVILKGFTLEKQQLLMESNLPGHGGP